jgi:hypothetical protein
MASKQNRSQEFKRAIDMGQVELASPTDLVKIWRIATGDEKSITLEGFVRTVDRDLPFIDDGNFADLVDRVDAIEEDLYDDPKFVPYVGAVENVILGDFGLSTNHIIYDTTPVNLPTVQGSTYWDVDDNTIAVILNGYTMKVGEDVFFAVKNQTGSTITKGTACGFAGTVGSSGRLLTKPYLANGVESSTFFMGVAAEEILDGADGKVLWFGRIRGLNTNAFDEGDILYVSTSSAGGFQTTVPQAPNNIIQVAAVITKSTNQGTIFVRPTIGSNINKDEGVKITTSANNQSLVYNSSTGLWENKITKYSVKDASGDTKFSVENESDIRFEGGGDTSVSFNGTTRSVIISSTGGSSGGTGVVSFNGRDGAVTSQSGDYDTSQVTEVTNLYFTEARVRATLLTGFSADNTPIVATDSVLVGFNKAQGQINARALATRNLLINGTTGRIVVTGGSQDLTADRTWGVDLATSGVTAGTYNNVTVDVYGRVTIGSNVSYLTTNQTITLSGDVTGSGTTAITTAISNQAVTYAKIQNVTSDRLLGRITTAGTVQELTPTQVRTLLNVADGANNYTHPNHSGDVVSVGDGATTISNQAVTYAKIQNVTADRILGRITTTGTAQELTAAQVRTLLNVANGANNYVHPNHSGDVVSVGDGATTISDNAVTNNKFRQSVGFSVVGKTATGTGNVADIVATADGVLRRSGTGNVEFGTLVTGNIGNSQVTLGKIANIGANTILGNNTGGAAAPIALTAAQVRTLLNVADGATANVGTVTSIATNNGVTGGTITGTGTIGLTGQALALHNLATNGLIARTGAGTVAGRTITGSTSISVTNGNGVSGNPTLSAIFGTTAGTVAEGSSLGNYVLKAGDTMTGDLSFDSSLNRSVIFNLGAQIRAAGAAFVISSGTGTSNNILLRPNGDSSTTGQMRVNSDGTVEIGSQATATNHAVLGARTITAGTGLTGGGNLTADRTLNVSFGTTAGTAAQGNDSRFHNPVTIGTANGLSLSTQVLSLALASGSTTGALSSANWTTFNNKVGGSGANTRVSFWDGTNSQSSDSLFTWDNTGKILSVGNQSGLRGATAAFVISANTSSSNRILLRPNGDTSTTNQFDINTDFIRYNGDFLINTAGLSGGGKLQVNGAINTNSTILTADPDAGARHPWKLGRASGFLDTPPDPQLTIRVEINGVKYDLLAVSVSDPIL